MNLLALPTNFQSQSEKQYYLQRQAVISTHKNVEVGSKCGTKILESPSGLREKLSSCSKLVMHSLGGGVSIRWSGDCTVPFLNFLPS